MPQSYNPQVVTAPASETHPQYVASGKAYAVGDIFTHTDGGKTAGYIVQTAFTSTSFVADSIYFDPIGESGSTYSGTATVNIGEVEQGDSFANNTIQEVAGRMFASRFSDFEISGVSVLEVGDSISAGIKTFTWSSVDSGGLAANSISIIDVTGGSVVLGSSLADDGTEDLTLASAITKTIATTHTFKIEGTDNNAGTIEKEYDVEWQWRKYTGKDTNVGPLIESEVEALSSSSLDAGFSGTYSFGAGAGYVYFAFPQDWGTAAIFKDASTNLSIPMEASYVVSLTNANSVVENYNIHRSTNQLNGAIDIIVS